MAILYTLNHRNKKNLIELDFFEKSWFLSTLFQSPLIWLHR